ncbi:hypothetical protein DACRYDRAFT_101461 [Dacryopinax primogenitus]|uniref:BHLH domain-containing protein n=1 Tax=Dacryopinax primogenitus (strain DJM 731) TaxID=1858805 RepID=M5FTH3_DACPD|nr:uncharacterized protein DACRYDRAFT_101461 [Dacryopinax primogenitus]EJT99378.1 hypothetical protein DACRYDRAFT_101461 [Dacryopinax primogenitus]
MMMRLREVVSVSPRGFEQGEKQSRGGRERVTRRKRTGTGFSKGPRSPRLYGMPPEGTAWSEEEDVNPKRKKTSKRIGDMGMWVVRGAQPLDMEGPIFHSVPIDDPLSFYSNENNFNTNTNSYTFTPHQGQNSQQSQHSSPASASTSSTSTTDDSLGSLHPRTPSPPDLTTPRDLDTFNLSVFPPNSIGSDEAFAAGIVNWDGFDSDWDKFLHPQHHDTMLPSTRQQLQKQEQSQSQGAFNPQLTIGTFTPTNEFVIPPDLNSFDFPASAVTPFSSGASAAPTSANSEMRFPLSSGYPDTVRHSSVGSSTSAHGSPPSGQPLPGQHQSGYTMSAPGSVGVAQAQPILTPTSAMPNLKSSQSPPGLPTVSFNFPTGAPPGQQQTTQGQKQPTKRRLTPHNTIERRYRRNLNSCIQALRDAVPAVAILDRERWGDRWIPDERGYVDGVRRAGKNSKSVVLEKGVEYIGVLNRRASRLTRERTALQALLCSFPQGQMLYTQWEHTFLPMDRHLYGTDELFRIPHGVPLAEVGMTEGDALATAEEEEEDGDDWDDEGDDDDDGGRRGKRQRVSMGEVDGSGMVVPALPPMNGVEAERRKRGRPRKNTQPSLPQPTLPSPPQAGVRTSPPSMTRLSPDQQMAVMTAQRQQQFQMQQQQYALQQRQAQQLHQMAAMQQQQVQQVQTQLRSAGPGGPGQLPFSPVQQQPQQGAAPRYLLAAFLCFSIFRSGGVFSTPAEPGTQTGTVLTPGWAKTALGPSPSVPTLGVHTWLDVAQLAVVVTLCATLFFGGAGWARPRSPKLVTKDGKTQYAESAILRRRGVFSRGYAIFSLLPALFFPTSVEERALLALLLPNWIVLRSIAASLWNGAAADIADEEEQSGVTDAVLHAAFQLDLPRAKELIRRATLTKSSMTTQPALFDTLARAAIQEHVTERATSRFISVANAAFNPKSADPEGADFELAHWAEQSALQLGGESRKLLEAWDDLEFGIEADDIESSPNGRQDDARLMLDAIAMLYSCIRPEEDNDASRRSLDALRLRLRRILGNKTFDASLRLADARDRVVDLLDPRRRR